MNLKLMVIRTPDIKKLAELYSLFGLTFEYHRHGNSPYHYSAMLDGTTLEIYPLNKNQTEADKYLRLGFSVADIDDVIPKLKDLDVCFESELLQTEFGWMAVVIDPDGRKVEIYPN